MSYRRGWVTFMLFLLTLINYIDRTTLSFAIFPIDQQFHLSNVAKGWLFSSFIWSYTLCVIPMGLLVDRFGAKRVVSVGMTVWSLATIVTGLAGSFGTMLATRLVMGGGEAATNPSGAQVIREWFPTRERGITNACFNGGGYAGPALCSLAAGPIIAAFGWHALFYISGAIGLVWMVIWTMWFTAPGRARWLSHGERSFILDGRADAAGADEGPRTGLWRLLRQGPTLFGIGLAMGCNVYSLYVFLTWIPSYLHNTKGLSISGSGLYTAILYGTALVLSLAIGRFSDYLLRNKDVTRGGRRYLIAGTMALAAVVLFAPVVNSLPLLIALLALSLSGVAATTSQLFSLANDLLPRRPDVGAAMGFVIVGGNVFGMLAPIVTGYVITLSGSYSGAFVIAGVLLVIGMLSLLLLSRQPIGAKWGTQSRKSVASSPA